MTHTLLKPLPYSLAVYFNILGGAAPYGGRYRFRISAPIEFGFPLQQGFFSLYLFHVDGLVFAYPIWKEKVDSAVAYLGCIRATLILALLLAVALSVF